MTPFFHEFAAWLADYYLLACVLLVFAIGALTAVKQPANRRAITHATLIGLLLLAALCAVPGWSLLNLTLKPEKAPIDQPAVTNIGDFDNTIATILPLQQPADILLPPVTDKTADVPSPASTPPRSMPWSMIVVYAWISGAIFCLAWLTVGLVAAHRLRRNSQLAPDIFIAMLRDLEQRGSRRGAELLTSSRIDVAVALGIFRPAVLLPEEWLRTQSHDDLRTVLAHEAAHLRNHDLHWLALSRALNVLLWAQPLFWLLRRRMRLDQEALADAAAAELTSRDRYAEKLVALAHVAASRPTIRLSTAVGLWEGSSQLRRRVALLLDERFSVLRSCTRRWRIAAGCLAITTVLALSTLTLQPPERANAQTQPAVKAPPTPTDNAAATAADESQTQPRPNTFAGRVVDENGQPLAGVEVFLFRLSYADALRKVVGEQVTDADGQFQFDNVIDIPKEFPDRKFRPRLGLQEEFVQIIMRSPGKVTESWLNERQILAHRGTFRRVTMKPAVTLRGHVTSPDGEPVEGALVTFGTLGPAVWDGAMADRTDENGNFEINDIAPFDMQQHRDQVAEQRRDAEKKSAAGEDSATLFTLPPSLRIEHPDFAVKHASVEKVPSTQDVQLEPAAILEGRVVLGPTGEPAAGARVEANTSRPTGNQFVPFQRMHSLHRAVVRADENGRYRFTTLPAGTYDLSAHMPNWVDLGISDVAAEAGKTTTTPDLTLSKGGVISVRLVDNETKEPIDIPPDTGAAIAAHQFPLRAISQPMYEPSLAANAEKRFELRTPPGKRLVWVSHVRVGDEFRWRGTAPLGGEGSIVVDVVEGETVEVDVPVVDAKEAEKATGSATDRIRVQPFDVRLNPREAIELLSKTLKERPDDVRALCDRAVALETLGEYGNAVADYEKVIELNPDGGAYLIAHNNLAYLLSTSPDDSIRNGKRAVELAKKAQQLSTEPIPELFDTLAAAYAESGDFDEAVKAQQQAIEMKPENPKFREHLKLYQAKQPLRDDRGAPARSEESAFQQ